MKSTDTILGAFAVLGFVLLGIFAFAGNTDEAVIETTELDLESEEVLNVDESLKSEEVLNAEVKNTNEEVLLSDKEDAEDEAINSLAAEMYETGLVDNLDPAAIKNGIANFLQGGDPVLREEILSALTPQEREEILAAVTEVEEDLEQGIEEVEVKPTTAEIEQEIINQEQNRSTDEVAEAEVDSEVEMDETEEKPSRLAKFLSNLFGGDEGVDIGGTIEDLIDSDEVVVDEGSYVVEEGDNIWDVLTNDYGYSAGQAATAINDMRGSSEAAAAFGVTSGDVDLIFPGQVLNIGALN